MTYDFENRISIQPFRICLYQQYVGNRTGNKTQKYKGSELKGMKNGMSFKSQIRLKNAINTLVYTAKWKTLWIKKTNSYFRYKINFITLTLPSQQIHTDSEITRLCLRPFLEAWQKRRNGLLYIWKAEIQDNGNIHYHITSNSFYHYKKLRNDWNYYVQKLGYVERSKSRDPNSTDVHSVQKIRNIASYLVSYMNKKDLYNRKLKRWHRMYRRQLGNKSRFEVKLPKKYFENIKRKIKDTIWNSSKPLKISSVVIDPDDSKYEKDIKMILDPRTPKIQHDYCTIIYMESDVLEMLPSFYNAYKTKFNDLIKLQNLIPDKEEIE